MGKRMKSLEAHRTYFTVIRQRNLGTGFFDDTCKEFYLLRLLRCQNAFHIQLHAYLLMERQIFLMFTPQTPSGFGAFIRFLSASYNNYFSIRFERQVHAWQNTPPICQLPNIDLVRDCQKFVERFALTIKNVSHPGEYRYSSYCANAFSVRSKFLKRHRAIIELSNDELCVLERYREFIAAPFREEHERFLQSRLLYGRSLLGKRGGLELEKVRALTDIEKSVTIA